ncbi:glycosyltransferase [Hymenobacter busanensis]|uniref:Glycosyltransferase n=1 Tax=Hymenobacter busanensis TaxID=2607656 RepID=A0A7L5A2P6_9BACT|nr:glycosyltransferase [Hymenobacter busanensis]KAA9338179.1 glycosyltransferase [Hymenobacter busanensis]QHJ09396.1 glycosyltransferase [Hymenobacter busanensis]
MDSATSSAVLLLSWADAPGALHTAHALGSRARVQLWVPQPLPATLDASAVHVAELNGPVAASFRSKPDSNLQTPAFPYLGASSPQPAGRRHHVAIPAAPYVGSSAGTNAAGPALQPSTPETTEVETPLTLGETPEVPAEPGAAEAAALSSPAPALPDVLPDGLPADHGQHDAAELEMAPPPSQAAPAAQPTQEAATAPAEDFTQLNFRIIQYARHAVQRAASTPFEVIVAAEWPTWLAAVELRQLTRRPLVLQVGASPVEQVPTADRGWVGALERLALRHADVLWVPDEATAQRISAQYHLPASRFRVLADRNAPNLTAALVLQARQLPDA